jgi:hypothetical protein
MPPKTILRMPARIARSPCQGQFARAGNYDLGVLDSLADTPRSRGDDPHRAFRSNPCGFARRVRVRFEPTSGAARPPQQPVDNRAAP